MTLRVPDPSLADSFEDRLAADSSWALSEGSQFFHGSGSVQETLRRICARFDALRIPCAVCGGMALFAHGYRRFTEVVDVLVTEVGLQKIHSELKGLGYTTLFPGSKHFGKQARRFGSNS